MIAEARGLGKQPENARWLLGFARGLNHRLGQVYIDLGQPLRLRERLAELRGETRRKRMPSSGSRWRCRTGSTGRHR